MDVMESAERDVPRYTRHKNSFPKGRQKNDNRNNNGRTKMWMLLADKQTERRLVAGALQMTFWRCKNDR